MSLRKVRVGQILVGKTNQALVTGGTALVNATTGALNVSDGQLGIFNAETKVALSAGDTFADHPEIMIVQGNDGTAPAAFMPIRPFEGHAPINGSNVESFTGKSYSAPTHNVVVIGQYGGAAAADINVVDNVEYQLLMKYDGRRTDILNGRNQPVEIASVDAKDYSALTTANATDEIVQRMVHAINELSVAWPSQPGGANVIALALDSAGTGSGTLVSGLSGATTIDETNAATPVAISVTLSADEVTSIQKCIIANGGLLPNATKVEAVDISAVATGATTCDHILLLVRDSAVAFNDRIPQVKERVEVGLRQGFLTTVGVNVVDRGDEGNGLARQWQLAYDSEADLMKYDTAQAPGGDVFNYTSPVVAGATYDAYNITYNRDDYATSGIPSKDYFGLDILIPIGDTATTLDLESVLNPWMASLPSPKAAVNL